jgi:colanic acid biosynthesis glycosyl transferase WcaI
LLQNIVCYYWESKVKGDMESILIVTPHFYPENFKINDFALDFVKRGYRVDVLTAVPDYPRGSFYPGYGIFKNNRQIFNGVRIFRSPIVARGKGTGVNLAINYISLLIGSVITAATLINNKYDLIFVYEPSPITIGIPAIFLKKALRIPLVFWVLDLWPESVIAASKLNNQKVIQVLEPLVRWIYKHSDKILVSSRGYLNSVQDKVDATEKVEYFPQWAESIFKPLTNKNYLLNSIPRDSFKIMFAGNIGEAQDFSSIIEAAISLRDHKDIQWIVLGSGRKLGWVQQKIQENQLEGCFHMLGSFPMEKMPEFYAHADAMLFSLKSEHIFSITVPAKVQSYLACGKPVLAMIDGEGADIIDEAEAGYTSPAEDPKKLVKNILKMSQSPSTEMEQMGLNALAYYRANFDREYLLNKAEIMFSSIQGRFSG